MSRLFALSDIHGHMVELMGLYQQLLNDGMDPERDQLVFCGDCVDGGPDTKGVLDQLIAWQEAYPHWVFLRGNHEDMMLDALVRFPNNPNTWNHWWTQGGRRTAQSYLPKDASDYERAIMQPEEYIDPKHLEWISSLPYMYEHPNYFFVHAGFRPGVPVDQQSEEDMTWIREDFFNPRCDFGKPVIYGHTPIPEPAVRRALVSDRAVKPIVSIGIDTMVGDYGKLTAVELNPDNPQAEPRFFFQPAGAGPFQEFRGFR